MRLLLFFAMLSSQRAGANLSLGTGVASLSAWARSLTLSSAATVAAVTLVDRKYAAHKRAQVANLHFYCARIAPAKGVEAAKAVVVATSTRVISRHFAVQLKRDSTNSETWRGAFVN